MFGTVVYFVFVFEEVYDERASRSDAMTSAWRGRGSRSVWCAGSYLSPRRQRIQRAPAVGVSGFSSSQERATSARCPMAIVSHVSYHIIVFGINKWRRAS